MLTRNRKKRKADKDKICSKESNLKYPPVHGDDAVEVGEMVTMDYGGTSGGLDDDGERTDYLQVAWLLREKLNDFVDGEKEEFPELELRSLLDMAASRNIVSVDPKMQNPVLWRTLPKELLLLVFARLPFPDITRLRCLSREWRRDMATVNSGINRACHEVSPPMVALLLHSSPDTYFVKIYDIKNCRWKYAYHFQLPRLCNDADLERLPSTWTVVDACDDGLVCFISLRKPTKHNRVSMVVVNLLTRVQHKLPPLQYKYFDLPAMVQLKVDTHTKCYKVVVAGRKRGGLTLEMYDSGTRQWTRGAPPSGSILGLVHSWTSMSGWCQKLFTTLGAYDFSEGILEYYWKGLPFVFESLNESVLQKDRKFELQKQTQMDASQVRRMGHQGFCITEDHLEKQTKKWVRWRSYECPFFYEFIAEGLTAVRLNACEGFLMLIFHHGKRNQYFRLLDLSTSEWSTPAPENANAQELHTTQSLLCRAFWNVVP